MTATTHVLKKTVATGILGVIAALTIVLTVGVSPAQADRVTGRAVIGTITSVGADTITVSTDQGEFTLSLEAGTRISAPKTRDAGVSDLAANEGGRVAILADQKLVNDDGTPVDQAAAVKVSVIPSKATREHRRVVVTEKLDDTEGTAVDAEGNSTELIGAPGSGFNPPQFGLPETGESAVLLVRPGAADDQKDEVRAVVKARAVVERLSRLAEELKTQEDDVFRSARIEELLDRHRDAVKERLDKARARAEERFKEVIQRAEERAAKALETTRETRGVVSGLDDEKTACVRSILGSVPGSKADIPPGQLQRIEVQCLRERDGKIHAKLTSPRPGTTLVEGEDIEVRFETGELGDAVIQLLINGEVQTLETPAGRAQGLRFRVPIGEPIMSVELRAIGNGEAIQKLLYDVRRDPPPRLRITGAVFDRELSSGSTISLGAQAEDNGEVVSIEIAVNGAVLASRARISSFAGLEYLVPAGVSSVQIEATATDDLGNTTTVTRTIKVAVDPGPEVEIVSPAEDAVIIAGTDFNIDVKADDNDRVVSVSGTLATDSSTSRLAFLRTTSALPGMDWRAVANVPTGTTSVKVEVTATDSAGNTATAGRGWNVQTKVDRPPSVRIISPRDGASVTEGSPITVQIEATDDGRITAAEINWPLIGEMASAGPVGALWVAETTAPTLSASATAQVYSAVPPHVFLGRVTIGGVSAPDGTRVTAWVDGSSSSRTTLEATATDDGGQTSTTSISLVLLGPQVQVGEATVADGSYTLFVSPLQGQNFTGKTIHFRVGGIAVSQTGSWEQGGGTELPLSR